MDSWATLLKLVDRGELFHVVDVETTGLASDVDRVIELATVTVREGEVIDRFSTLIDPGEAVSATTTRLTGINDRMLEGAPKPEVALGRWLAYLGGGGQFVAHNAVFDWKFLKAECARAGLEFPFRRKFCTMKLAGHFYPYGGRLALAHMVKRFGVEAPGGTHRALADAEAAAGLFIQAVGHLKAGTHPSPQREVAPLDTEGDPWEALVRHIKQTSFVTAAILNQAGPPAGVEAGTLRLAVSPQHLQYFENQGAEKARVEAAVRQLYGEETTLLLEPRPSP